jgi:Putative metal-binding motif
MSSRALHSASASDRPRRARVAPRLGAARLLLVAVALVAADTTHATAQTDPLTFPLVNLANVTPVGSFRIPAGDGAGGLLDYGGGALGVSEDGKYIYWSCQMDDTGIAKLEIPALGAIAKVVAPCAGPRRADIAKIHPDPNQWRPVLGGVLEQGGRITVTAYIIYDAGGTTVSSHWSGPSLSQLQGPFSATVKPGMVKSQMAAVPPEWRQLLGGPAMSSAGYTSIISRASYGASVSIFDPKDVTGHGFPMTMVLGCPHSVASCITYGTPTSNDYNGSERWGGMFIPSGTRTLVAIEREASGPTCYGYATTNQALHGTPYPNAANPSPENVPWCYSLELTDLAWGKGPKGYPYRLVAKLYDVADLVAVKRGQKLPWNVKQYATVDLPGSSDTEFVTSGALNPVTGDYYLVRYDHTNGMSTVFVYRGFAAGGPPPPPTEVCGDGLDNDGDGLIDEGCTTEVCGDGIDNDGDGQVDEGCPAETCGDGVDNDGDGQVDEGCVTTSAAPGAPQRLSSSVRRSTVSFKWAPPLTGGRVTEYILEAGVSPGTTIYTAPVGATTSMSVAGVGNGRYYVRVRGRNAVGTGPASNEVTVSVGCGNRPGRPSQLSATTSGGLVTLAWVDPDGCSGTKYDITVGSQTVQSDEASFTGVLPAGTYTARVTSRSDVGASEVASVQFTVAGGACPTPTFRTSLQSSVTGNVVSLSWGPLQPDAAERDDRLAPVSYVLEAGSAAGAANIGAFPMGRANQFFTGAPSGVYFVRVRPANTCGGGVASNEVTVVVP